MQPIYIGLGGQRCGSTWLHDKMERHSGVIVAQGEKEVHFFDRRWDRGRNWYISLFNPGAAPSRRVFWESTPSYLYTDGVLERILQTLDAPRFIVLLRDPVGRSKSHYRRFLLNSGRRLSFPEAVERQPSILRYSRYDVPVKRYIDAFGAENVFTGLYEEILTDPQVLLDRLVQFMGIASMKLSDEILQEHVNKGRVARSGLPYSILYRSKQLLQTMGLDTVVEYAKKLNVAQMAAAQQLSVAAPGLTPEDMALLQDVRDEQIECLLPLGIDASRWRL